MNLTAIRTLYSFNANRYRSLWNSNASDSTTQLSKAMCDFFTCSYVAKLGLKPSSTLYGLSKS